MANVNIKFNGKEYLLSCDDGQEESLKKLTSILDKKYTELQTKLGQTETDQAGEEAGEGEAEGSDEEVSETTPAFDLISKASEEYYANNNSLSAETIEKFSEMSSTDIVNAYIESIKNAPAQQQEEVDIPDAQVNQIQNSVGGEKQYTNIVSWAANNLPEKQVLAYDDLVASGNVEAINLALAGLKAQYDNAFGNEGRTLQGRSPRTSDGVFKSQAELISAMSDPRYDKDPAYRQDLYDKLERSNVQF